MTWRHTSAWDFGCSFQPKETMILPVILFPLVFGQPFTFQWNRHRLRVPRIELTWGNPSGEICACRLPSNHPRPRKTNPGFAFPTSQDPLRIPSRSNPSVSVAKQPFSSEANGLRIRVPHVSRPPENPVSVKPERIGCLATILIREKRTADSNSRHRITPDSFKTSRSSCPVRYCSFDPVIDKQTNKLI